MSTSSKQYPPVVVVDENDVEIGSAMLAEAWQKGLYHRVVAIFIQDEQGRMLLQLRGPNVLYPNRWDQAAGGHVDEGYSYEQTALTEVREELGIDTIGLNAVDTYRVQSQDNGRIMNQFERVYSAHISHETELHHEESEVSELRWFTPDELQAAIANNSEQFTPGLLYNLQHYFPAFMPSKLS